VSEIALGGYHEVDVPIPALLTAVLLAGTDRFQIAHNHPSGDVSPTMYDVDMVHTIMGAANSAGMYFEDSLIVGPRAETYSFLANGLIVPAADLVEMATGTGHAPFTRAKAS
jgi:DNA repair protein RadC